MKTTVTFYMLSAQHSLLQSSYTPHPSFSEGDSLAGRLQAIHPSPWCSLANLWNILPYSCGFFCLDTLSVRVVYARTLSFNVLTLQMLVEASHFLGTTSWIPLKNKNKQNKTTFLFYAKSYQQSNFPVKIVWDYNFFLFLLLKYFIINIFSLLTKENRFNSHRWQLWSFFWGSGICLPVAAYSLSVLSSGGNLLVFSPLHCPLSYSVSFFSRHFAKNSPDRRQPYWWACSQGLNSVNLSSLLSDATTVTLETVLPSASVDGWGLLMPP